MYEGKKKKVSEEIQQANQEIQKYQQSMKQCQILIAQTELRRAVLNGKLQMLEELEAEEKAIEPAPPCEAPESPKPEKKALPKKEQG